MGLPRYLVEKREAYLRSLPRGGFLCDAVCAGADYGPLVFDVLNKTKPNGKVPPWRHVLLCFIQARWAFLEFRQYRKHCVDNMNRVSAELYIGLEQFSPVRLLAELRSVSVPIYFLERLRQLNLEREERDRTEARLATQIEELRNKVYLSRCFPSRLRYIIFARDKYCCQICLRGRDKLLRLGLHLEVDHIIPFVDGGKTTYTNGITLCNECNIAKHLSKAQLRASSELDHIRKT
jgi:5-methylcytosine-specific restriction endonuclease McrA